MRIQFVLAITCTIIAFTSCSNNETAKSTTKAKVKDLYGYHSIREIDTMYKAGDKLWDSHNLKTYIVVSTGESAEEKTQTPTSTTTGTIPDDQNRFTSIELRIEYTNISRDEHHPTPIQGYIANDGTLKLLTVASK